MGYIHFDRPNPFGSIDYLLSFLRLDKSKIQLERVGIKMGDKGIEIVELTYHDIKTKELKRCVIGINGAKINEFATRQH